MGFVRPLLVLFAFMHVPVYAKHITVDNLVSGFGFLLFCLNELHKAIQHIITYREARRGRKRAKSGPRTLKAPVITESL